MQPLRWIGVSKADEELWKARTTRFDVFFQPS
jgi:hypothetical protein